MMKSNQNSGWISSNKPFLCKWSHSDCIINTVNNELNPFNHSKWSCRFCFQLLLSFQKRHISEWMLLNKYAQKKYSCFFFPNDVHVSWDDYNFILVLYLHLSKGAIIPFEDAAKEWAVWWGIVSLCFVELGISFEQSNQDVLQIITRHIHTHLCVHTLKHKNNKPPETSSVH